MENEENNNNISIEQLKYDDTTCPMCMKGRFWLTFYGGKTLLYCRDCGYFAEI